MMLRIPSNCRWQDSVALGGSCSIALGGNITLHWMAELIAVNTMFTWEGK
jgi:hypothetical protein